MSNVPQELRYTKNHEWVMKSGDDVVTVGITDHAQHLLGDLVFVELPEIGNTFGQDEDCAVVESVKAASDVYCPLDGEIVGHNEALADTPELINQDPYGDGWIFKLRLNDAGSFDELLDADAYNELIADE